jgi:hypothetical protein
MGLPGTSQVVSFGTEDKTIIVSDLMVKSIVGKVVNRAVTSREKVQFGIWNDQLLVGGVGGQLYTYDLGTLKLINTTNGNGSPIYCVVARKLGEVASGDQSGCVKFWTL